MINVLAAGQDTPLWIDRTNHIMAQNRLDTFAG